MSKNPDWNELIQKHLDGLTTEAEAESLSAGIVENPQLRRSYLRAAQIHAALTEDAAHLELEHSLPAKSKANHPIAWPQHLAAALVAGALFGLIGAGLVWAVGTPKSEARILPLRNGNFEQSLGPTNTGFPKTFGTWSGDPAEVIERTDGNRVLRFLETANVKGDPNGGAAACNVFQLIDLSHLQQERASEDSDARMTLEFSARFFRESNPSDDAAPKARATCSIQLYQAAPESIGKHWPLVISDALALGNKAIHLNPDGDSGTITTSCFLDPDANLALISINVNAKTGTRTPTPLGGWYADDVQLKLIKQPNLPVRLVD